MTKEEYKEIIYHKVNMAETWNKRADLLSSMAKQTEGDIQAKYTALTNRCLEHVRTCMSEAHRLMVECTKIYNVERI